MATQGKINGKDLINIGIYAAIYCVVMTAIAMLGFIPIMMPMLAVLCPLIGGIPMMLFYTKVKKFGMITIMGIIIGLFLMITGMGVWPAILGVVFGLLADLVAKSGGYASAKKSILSYATMCLLIFGNYIPLYLDIEGYFSTRQSFGEEYIATLTAVMQPWTAPVILVACFVFGALGAIIGQKLMKKHFEKAGIA